MLGQMPSEQVEISRAVPGTRNEDERGLRGHLESTVLTMVSLLVAGKKAGRAERNERPA